MTNKDSAFDVAMSGYVQHGGIPAVKLKGKYFLTQPNMPSPSLSVLVNVVIHCAEGLCYFTILDEWW